VLFRSFVDEKDYRTLNLGSYKWFRIIGRTTTYVATDNNGKTLYLHRLIMGLENASRSVCVDHRDHNGLNNSRTNLRVTDNRNNQRNRRKTLSAKTSSSYKGVCWDADKNKHPWVAYITLSDGKQKNLGCYRTEIEAARSYNKAAIKHYGTMAYLNVIRL
jgi:hypothetical protein